MERALRDEKNNLGRGIEEAGLAAVLIEVGGRKRVGDKEVTADGGGREIEDMETWAAEDVSIY